MADKPKPLFLARQSYRRRRLTDAATLVPFFGTVLLCIPAMWAASSRTAPAMVYVFTVWAVLILVMALIARRLKDPLAEDDDPKTTPPDPQER